MRDISLILLLVFAGLLALTLTDYWVRRRRWGEQLQEIRERLAYQEERMASIRQELDDMSVETELLEQECLALEARQACMRGLDRYGAADNSAPGQEATYG